MAVDGLGALLAQGMVVSPDHGLVTPAKGLAMAVLGLAALPGGLAMPAMFRQVAMSTAIALTRSLLPTAPLAIEYNLPVVQR